MPFPSEALELARLRALGQLPPDNVDLEGPSDYVSPAEQSKLLPRGLATPAHAGGLQDVAAASRLQDSVNSAPPPPAAPQPSADETQSNRSPVGPAAIAASGPGPQVNWTSSDPSALADAVRDQKDAAAEASLAHSTGQLIRLAATTAVGGAAAGGAGAAGGAASGTGAGAASGAGFGSNYWAGLGEGGGAGAGGFLGRLSSGLLTGKTTGVEQDPTARLLMTLYGMA